MTDRFDQLLNPAKVWSRGEVLAPRCPVPEKSGLYAWYFSDVPELVPVEGCKEFEGRYLLYCGISSRRPSSSQRLRGKLRSHYRGNASSSTLRLSLGCLLSDQLGIRLQVTGGSKRKKFGKGEEVLSNWMARNAYVVWMIDSEPWLHEGELIRLASPPLNLQGNKGHPFHPELSRIRKICKERANETIGDDGLTIGDAPEPEHILGPRDTAKEFLEALLQDGRIPATEIFEEAGQAGISRNTLYCAKAELKIVSKKELDIWYWSLPGRDMDI